MEFVLTILSGGERRRGLAAGAAGAAGAPAKDGLKSF